MTWVLYLRVQGLLAQAHARHGEPLVVVQQGRVLDFDAQAGLLGIEAGRPLREARLLCPQAQQVEYSEAVARPLYEAWLSALVPRSGAVEPYPPHGVFISCPGGTPPLAWARALVTLSAPRYGHTVSAGLAGNKLVAQLAARPGTVGLVVPDQSPAFMRSQPPEALWLLPEAARKRLRGLGITRLGQLQQLSLAALQPHLGALAALTLAWARGEDPRPVVPAFPPRSEEGTISLEPPTRAWPALQKAAQAALQAVCQQIRPGEGLGSLTVGLVTEQGAQLGAHRTFSTPKPPGSGVAIILQHLLEDAYQALEPHTAVVSVAVRAGRLASLPLTEANLFAAEHRQPADRALAVLAHKYQGRAVQVASQLPTTRMEQLMRHLDPLRNPGKGG